MSCWIKIDFLLKNVLVLQNDKVRRILWFWWFCRIWPVKRTCMHTYTHMWLMCIHSWGNLVLCLVFGSILLVVLKLWNMWRTWLNLIFKPDYLAYLFGIVWYDYMKMCELFLGVEYDDYHNVLYFSPLLELLYEVVDLWCCWYWCECW